MRRIGMTGATALTPFLAATARLDRRSSSSISTLTVSAPADAAPAPDPRRRVEDSRRMTYFSFMDRPSRRPRAASCVRVLSETLDASRAHTAPSPACASHSPRLEARSVCEPAVVRSGPEDRPYLLPQRVWADRAATEGRAGSPSPARGGVAAATVSLPDLVRRPVIPARLMKSGGSTVREGLVAGCRLPVAGPFVF